MGWQELLNYDNPITPQPQLPNYAPDPSWAFNNPHNMFGSAAATLGPSSSASDTMPEVSGAPPTDQPDPSLDTPAPEGDTAQDTQTAPTTSAVASQTARKATAQVTSPTVDALIQCASLSLPYGPEAAVWSKSPLA